MAFGRHLSLANWDGHPTRFRELRRNAQFNASQLVSFTITPGNAGTLNRSLAICADIHTALTSSAANATEPLTAEVV
jgi:hypothetical protein